ncbi:hypothetical protein NHX12_002106 [Muraenolepis orangiensis]|uniref:threonine--tRNA ligase n=1 Tax=Muraenolepis orangiensis TaxID=630683 RepID=A0A9Q0IHV8_9TELE|nr:hypothetical protein NHX12_002106 [Muraenolepis orangiensis]
MVLSLLLRTHVCRTSLHTFRSHRRYNQVSSAVCERLRLFESFREVQSNGEEVATDRPLTVRLADGRTLEGAAGVTTPLVVAQRARVKGPLVSRVNGVLWDLVRPLEADCELELLGFDTIEGKQTAWRTAVCVLGGVLEGAFGAVLCREGVSEHGLYCDHLLDTGCLSLSDVEERCKEAAACKLPLSTLQLRPDNSPLRLQLVEEQMDGQTLTVYRCGDSLGVCDGPLLPNTGILKVFKMLQLSPITLANQRQSSGGRDHRRIGKDQELFFFDDVSPGSCFFLPKGAHIYNTLTDFIKSEYRRRGFDEVVTPTLYSTALWERSGHWEHYSENMFTVVSKGTQTYSLKPMNCPAHCLMFEQRVRSWRELPLRWADFGALHRNEPSGALGGLTRVRRFCQDDAHIFCTPEQLEEEMVACLEFVRCVYRVFGFSFHCMLSTRPTPCLGEPQLWDTAEQQLQSSLEQFGERWELNPGDGAFYGPKIDIQIKDAVGRQHQCATIQLDFQLPIRFGLQYVGSDEQTHRPVMVHRAVLGSLERMIAILAENFAGKWPLWLSPAQVMVIPIGGSCEPYAKQVVQRFHEAGFMAKLNDEHGGTFNRKIRSAQLAQYNYILVVGERECASGTVSVRTRGGKQLGSRPTEEVLSSLTVLRDTRSNHEDF